MTAVEKTEVHESHWRGSLTGEEIRDILMAHLRSEAGAPYNGLSIKFETVAGSDSFFPTVSFELVHDHKWFLKADKDAD